MADQNDGSGQGKEPNLELPSLFGRKKRRKPPAEPVTDTPEPVEATQATETPTEITPQEPAETPVDEPAAVEPAQSPVVDEPAAVEPAQSPAVDEPAAVEPAQTPAVDEPVADEPAQTPVVDEPAAEQPVAHEPTHEEPVTEQTTVLPASTPAPVVRTLDDRREPEGHHDQHTTVVEEPPRKKKERKPRTPLTLPRINPRAAAAVTGVVVGLIGVALALVASRGCEAVRGVGSCGGFGLFALLAILAVMVLLGSILLKAWGLSDPTSTAFLGVGVVAVLTMLLFLGSIESLWMFLVIPALAAAAFVLSWWVTDTFVDVED